jgi:hypothetical protein
MNKMIDVMKSDEPAALAARKIVEGILEGLKNGAFGADYPVAYIDLCVYHEDMVDTAWQVLEGKII